MMLFNKNLVFYYFVLLFSMGYLVTAISLGNPIVESRLEPSFFPIVIGSFAVFFSLILLSRQFAKNKAEPKTSQTDMPASEKAKFAPTLIMLAIFVYILAFSYVGYFISSYLFVLSVILIFSSVEKFLQKAALSFIIALVGYLLFEQVFGVRLPALWE
ncbi:tripartite tricarboxylate transporter TctB family protein [Marinomonas sp.]